jgi:putative holliday junction resolvase
MHKYPSQTYLGFDFGMSRIGLAIGNSISQRATPLKTITAQDGIPQWEVIQGLLKKWSIDAIIVGMPYTLNNTHQDTTFAAQKFANRLKQKFKLPIHTVDERFTTKIASQTKNPKHGIDSVAACIILQAWLDENLTKTTDRGPNEN